MNQQQPTVLGRYTLLKELGRGKRTVVYLARQSGLLEREVALKVLRRYDPETLQKFQAEARLSAKLESPGVRSIYEAGQTPEGHVYLAMEYLESSLKDVMRLRQAQKKPFSRAEVHHLLNPIATALDEIHAQGLVHLDIKPENILISENGRAVLADFGITRPKNSITREGTPLYLSPEQASGSRVVGPWSDIYSLGVLIYEMITGRPPFVGEMNMVLVRQHLHDPPPPPHQFIPDIDRDLERVLLATLSKEPDGRPRSASALLRAISEPHMTPGDQVTRMTQRVKKTLRQKPQWAALPAGLLVIIITVVLVVLWPNGPAAHATPTLTPTSTLLVTPTPETRRTTPPDAPTPTTQNENPTSTPQENTPTPTPRPTVAVTPTPALENIALLSPANGATLKQTIVELRWDAGDAKMEDLQVSLYHRETRKAEPCELQSGSSCRAELPADLYGEWEWRVSTTSGDVESATWHFWLQPY